MPPDDPGEAEVLEPPTEYSVRRSRLTLACSVLVVVLVTAYRLKSLSIARYPGHADPAFYYYVAQNLATGRGASVDYVWQFLGGFPPLHHYAFDYWLPGPPLLMAAALRVHHSLSAALAVSVAMSVVLAIATFMLARQLSRSWWVPPVAMAIVVLQPNVSHATVQSEAGIYLAAFGVLAMCAAVGARQRPWLWLVAGALGGLANLSRSEGLLLVLVMALAAIGSSESGRRVRSLLSLAAGYLVVMAPLFVVNVQRLGSPLPRTTSLSPFINRFEDIYALHVHASVGALFAGGIDRFVLDRLAALQIHLGSLFEAFAAIDAVLVILLVGRAMQLAGPVVVGPPATWSRRAASSAWFVPVGFAVAVFGFWALIAPRISSGGALSKSLATVLPVLVIAALIQLDRLKVPGRAKLVVCVLLVLVPATSVATITVFDLHFNNRKGAAAAKMRPMLQAEQKCLDRPVVLMTRNPWEITQATGFPTVQIPNGPLSDILRVAAKYHATDIELNATRPALGDRTQLLASRVLTRTKHFPLRQVYRITADVGTPTC
ncbi:MAG: hypothetical protein QOF87_1558 [Pseudonocardiales bacterium]|nr:hypothetical protein [Pseudonocardiales bacterium]